MTLFRIRYKVFGGHIHCRLFSGKHPSQTFAKCGDFTLSRGQEFIDFTDVFSRAEFINETPNDDPRLFK